jgi:ribosomal protein RSM22 (predicted rRNA methylase)
LERVTVAKSSGKDLFKAARKAAWGDTFFIDRLQTAANQQGKRKQVRFFWGRDQRKRFNQAKDKNQAPKEAFDENKSYAVQVE